MLQQPFAAGVVYKSNLLFNDAQRRPGVEASVHLLHLFRARTETGCKHHESAPTLAKRHRVTQASGRSSARM